MANFIALHCTIKKAAFSGERVFVIQGNSGNYESLASVRYFLRDDGGKLNRNDPATDQMSGFVAAKLFKTGKEYITVETPDGELVEVPKETMATEVNANVLIES